MWRGIWAVIFLCLFLLGEAALSQPGSAQSALHWRYLGKAQHMARSTSEDDLSRPLAEKYLQLFGRDKPASPTVGLALQAILRDHVLGFGELSPDDALLIQDFFDRYGPHDTGERSQ